MVILYLFAVFLKVQFINLDGTENLHPRPPFRIRLPRTLKGNIHALPGNKKSSPASMNDVSMADTGSEQEKLIVEAYIPPDPGPYPQDQPKQNSVRFTPTQVQDNSFIHNIYFTYFGGILFCVYLCIIIFGVFPCTFLVVGWN